MGWGMSLERSAKWQERGWKCYLFQNFSINNILFELWFLKHSFWLSHGPVVTPEEVSQLDHGSNRKQLFWWWFGGCGWGILNHGSGIIVAQTINILLQTSPLNFHLQDIQYKGARGVSDPSNTWNYWFQVSHCTYPVELPLSASLQQRVKR